ncbi:hypothetical protein BDW59DRAFT_165392 [Aspergillus cavernicola]|uniref:NACHT domain-containing protein n=1 Tax=Aspergillus cavernicola TaxID=176166 RepID=A0ABR4HTB5_9EURO
MATPSLIQNAFQAAMSEFKTNLNNYSIYTKILSVTSIDEVYSLTDRLQAEQGRKGHLRHLSKIEPFLNRLREYAGVVEVFMQVQPDILALIWGPIKLLLQWSSVLTQSFDAIVNTMADIGTLLPEFKEVTVLFSQNTRIYEVLVLFFKDLMDIYLIGLKFFTMPRWKYFFEALWPRKREHINLVKMHIERHTLLMRNEVRLEHIREEHNARLKALEHFRTAERAHRLQQFHAIKTDVNPRSYDGKLDTIRNRVCKGTDAWLLQDNVFKNWLDVTGTLRILWLQGIPGAGKTFLAGTVVDKALTVGHTVYAFLTHALSSSTSALGILHSLQFQLASSQENLEEVLCHSTREHIKSNLDVAFDLFKSLLNCAGPVFLIVDGLDEIEQIERGILLKSLLDLSRECSESRILISSRPEDDIKDILESSSEKIRVDGRNKESIKAFVDHELRQISKKRMFPAELQSEVTRLLEPLASKAKGMFLYAKVVLSGVENVDNAAEICEELSVLPEDLDDAYARVLSRINKLRPPLIREKARKILGWVGCSPTPLALQEIEQALTIRPGSLEPERRVSVSPNLNRLCGPIIEVIDGYLHFVHFTVKEYLFSPDIKDHIDLANATLDLAVCCTTLLSQEHYGPDVVDDDDVFTAYLVDGSYNLHYFAHSCWFQLVQNYLQLTKNGILSAELQDCLTSLLTERKNDDFSGERGAFVVPLYLARLKSQYPDPDEFLVDVAQFRERCSQNGYHIRDGKSWLNLSPLSTFQVSEKLYDMLDTILCRSATHKPQCLCPSIQCNFSKRPYKCGFLNCPFERHGFESRAPQARHGKEHSRPWKCDVSGCEYENMGFLSRRMRDQHLERAHRNTAPVESASDLTMGNMEMQTLILDLVKKNEVETIRLILSRIQDWDRHKDRLLAETVGKFGSTTTAQLIIERRKIEDSSQPMTEIFTGSITTGNMELLYWLIESDYCGDVVSVIRSVLKSESQEMYRFTERYLQVALSPSKLTLQVANLYFGPRDRLGSCFNFDIIGDTGGVSGGENLLLTLWETIRLRVNIKSSVFTKGLRGVAQTTCSIPLATALIQYGADINGGSVVSPLQLAARKSSAENAEFMKFLLYAGADPNKNWHPKNSRGQKVSEGKCPQEISRWLGVSWDELVTQAADHRKSP